MTEKLKIKIFTKNFYDGYKKGYFFLYLHTYVCRICKYPQSEYH